MKIAPNLLNGTSEGESAWLKYIDFAKSRVHEVSLDQVEEPRDLWTSFKPSSLLFTEEPRNLWTSFNPSWLLFAEEHRDLWTSFKPSSLLSNEEAPTSTFARRVPFSTSSSLRNDLKSKSFTQFDAEYSQKLLDAIRLDPVIPGEVGRGDDIVAKCLRLNALAASVWLCNLFNKHYSRPSIAADLLLLVGRQPYDPANPNFVTMAIAGLSHKNRAVQEAAIRAFENWGRPEMAHILRSVRDLPGWLQSYLDGVIEYLEGNN